MQRRRLLRAVVISLVADGCTSSYRQSSPEGPPPGAVTEAAVYPPIGATWTARVTTAGIFHTTEEDRAITATSVDFNGRRGYGLANAKITEVLDPATFNPIGELMGGRVAVIDYPEKGLFSWPLWVGKAWSGTCSHADLPAGYQYPPAEYRTRIVAFEDVSVPAGTFKAFRIEYLGGIGSSTPGGRRDPGNPGFETRETHWYAPGPKLLVKSEIARLGTNYLGVARTTTELLSLPRYKGTAS